MQSSQKMKFRTFFVYFHTFSYKFKLPQSLGRLWSQIFFKYKLSSVDFRGHNRDRRPQVRNPRGSIEIVKCAILKTNRATLNVIKSRRHPQICATPAWDFRKYKSDRPARPRLYLSAL